MNKKIFFALLFFFQLSISFALFAQKRSTVPPQIQQKLDYVQNDSSDCTLEYIVTLEKELRAMYSSDDYVFFITEFRKGKLYTGSGEYTEAILHFKKAFKIVEKQSVEHNTDIANVASWLGYVYYTAGDYDNALLYFNKGLIIAKEMLGENHPNTARFYGNVGRVYYAKRDFDNALLYSGKGLAIVENMLGKKHPDTASFYGNIGDVYWAPLKTRGNLHKFSNMLKFQYEERARIFRRRNQT